MKKLLLFSGIFLPALFLKSQTVSNSVISSNGGSTQTAQGSIAWTIGEPVSETYNSGSNTATMGFLQPEAGLANMIREQGDDKQILIFPNPVKDEVFINFSGIVTGHYSFEVMDALGQQISKMEADISKTNDRTSIRIGEVAAGTYFLKISGKDFNKTVKLNKVY